MLASEKIVRRGAEGYDEARQARSHNRRVPDRFPEAVVLAEDEADVADAVRLAAAEGWQVAVRSGGHSFALDHLRDGGMLLDLAHLDAVEVDDAALTATAGPGRPGNELCATLDAAGLFFPTGHCKGVGLGGYLLQGGYGWNSRQVGVACESVTAVEVVTADGERAYADEHTNADLYWAARGAGAGFPGIVTRFHLRLCSKPAEFGMRNAVYPIEVLDELYSWAREVCPDVDRRVEMQLLMGSDYAPLGVPGKGVVLSSAVFAASEDEARAATAVNDTCPVREHAVDPGYVSMRLADAYELVMLAYPEGTRHGVDNMWTDAPAEALLPVVRSIAETLPPLPSHFLWLNWGPPTERPEMAYSLEAEVYWAVYGGWPDAADDERYLGWAESHMRDAAHLAVGIQLADENLGGRPARFVTDENLARLDAVRSHWDPEQRFHSWMGRP